jgi:uncharacterized SAM-binding protein YcdF (DUF218 family)
LRRRWSKQLRQLALLLISGAIFLFLTPLLWYGMDLRYVSTDNETDYAVAADVIIVLGRPSYEGNIKSDTFSACVQARAHHAARLYKRGFSAHIIPTGGLTGPPPTEAAAMASVMRGDGVPDSAIILEDRAHDTVQNIQFSRALMQVNGWRNAILVTEPNHIRRATLIARDGGLTVFPSPVTDSPGWNTPDARRQNLMGDARALLIYQVNRVRSGAP